MNGTIYDAIIIGSGPAGLTAAIYAVRANLKTLVVAGRQWGGQLMLTTLVENYPGFPEGIQGPDLMQAMRKQAENQGVQLLDANFKEADFTRSSPSTSSGSSGQAQNNLTVTTDDDKTFSGKAVIIATGADTKWLDVPGEKERIGRGVSSCAPCDAPFFRDKRVIVVGGGDSAMEEAFVLTKFANHVWVVHRKDNLRASDIMQKRSFENPKITFVWNTTIEQVGGENKVESVRLNSKLRTQSSKLQLKAQNEDKELSVEEIGGKVVPFDSSSPTLPTGAQGKQAQNELVWEFPVDGVFVAIGHIPNSQYFRGIEVDEQGYIVVHDHTKTNIPGVFVAGDVHDAHYKQAVTAAGFGCMAAMEIERWLRNNN